MTEAGYNYVYQPGMFVITPCSQRRIYHVSNKCTLDFIQNWIKFDVYYNIIGQ